MEPAPIGEWVETDFSAEDEHGSEIADPGLSVLCSAWHSVDDDRVIIGQDSHDPTHGEQSMAMPIAGCDSLDAAKYGPDMSPVTFTHFNGTWSNPLASLVTARFYLHDEFGEPVPYLASSSFIIRHGFDCRELGGGSDDGRAEGSVDVAGQRSFGSTKFITLLFDMSGSVTPEEMRQVLTTFITGMRGQRGDIYVKLKGFADTVQLTLTRACVEDFCLVGHENNGPQAEWNILLHSVNNYPTLVAEEVGPFPATNFYESMLMAAQEFKIASRARAALIANEPGYLPPSATTEHLLVFSDCVESVHVVPSVFREMQPEDPNWIPEFSYRRDLFATIQQGDLSSAISLIYLDPPSENTGSVSGGLSPSQLQNLEDDLDDLFLSLRDGNVLHAAEVSELAEVFSEMSEQIDREANAWYEMTFCPPERSGGEIFLQIQAVDQIQAVGGALETHYNAHGFQNTCADSAAFAQSETSSLCERKACGFQVR
eukprot:SAG31_NODE_266_length_18815_cov_17.009243_3_plen_484_part_00